MWDRVPGIVAGPGVVVPGVHVEYLPQHQPGPRVRHPRGGVIVSVGPKCVRWRPYAWDRDVRTPLDHMRVDASSHLDNRAAVRAEIAARRAGNPLPYAEWTAWSLTRHLEHAAAEAANQAADEARLTWDELPDVISGPGIVVPGLRVQCLPEHRPGPRVHHAHGGVVISVGPKCVRWRPYGADRDVRTPLDNMSVDADAHANYGSWIRAMRASVKAGRGLPAFPAWTRWTLAAHLEHAARRPARLARLFPVALEVATRRALTVRPSATRLPLPTSTAGRVIVIPCGAAKLSRPAPAGELYTGSFHRACRRAADALARPGGTVLVLSALHGLVPLDRVLAPYELRMGEAGSVTGEQLRAQARALGLGHAREVIVLAGAAYTAAARQAWPHATAPLEGAPGMGYQLQRLKALREGRYALAA
ncbi:DUF6884 domain-containing protein [Streptomyces fuscigenes]|uniref:DUF6884 domain-containing protein n=1 Tax=Streptomyces fuscigenes TaxID=1528880 RepID=UPI001F3A3D05|nr:DUF6884 domain-containing protein [Streptomyces fuscigenes]MCF3960288.1 hypothetical protein [Streptomyces fuscigenes]